MAEPGWVFALDAVTFVASAAFLSALPIATTERPPRRPFLHELAEGGRAAWSLGWMRAGLSLTAVTVAGIATFLVLGPVISDRDLGGATSWGVILAAGAVGGILGGAVALRLRPSRPLVGAFAGWSLAALPALALLPPLPTAVVAGAYGVFQAGIAFGNNQFDTVLQREIPSHLLSRVDSFAWLVALGLTPVGQALAGPASETFGTDTVLIAASVLVAASCAVGIATPSVRAITAPRA